LTQKHADGLINILRDLNTELLTQYGKIDILWYDVSRPMESWEGWDSLELNQVSQDPCSRKFSLMTEVNWTKTLARPKNI
jgi:hypothetical protein